MHHRLPRFLLCSVLASVPAFGLAIGSGAVAGASTGGSPATAQSHAAAARDLLSQLSVGQHAADQRLPGIAHVSGLTKTQSTNWSGYVDDNTSGHSYSKVTGSWTEPSVSCSSGTSLAAFWVGIDGYNSNSVEQDGTMAECSGGTASYYTWWEMYPSNQVQVVGQSLRPGDKITATVTKSGSRYALKVTDSTRPAGSFSTTQSCASCSGASAEWIAEAPSGLLGPYPLADFHSWSETGASAISGPKTGTISSFPDDEITMADFLGTTEAQPGSLTSGGRAFSVAWKSSS